jgi:Xaa-Pro aminopeptidase
MPGVHTPDAINDRLAAAQKAASDASVDALLVTPGPDLAYLTGYEAVALERLTCLVLPTVGQPVVVVPTLEQPAAVASPLGGAGIEIRHWGETEDPYALVAGLLATGTARVGLDNHMWAEKVLAFRTAMPGSDQVLAGPVLRELRMRKTTEEVDALRAAGQSIDRVHARMGEFLRVGRTERAVADDIRAAIVEEGHATAEFAIVAAGSNGASPHHDASDRVIADGDVVVVDIGGTMPSGYCSDSTRTYAMGAVPEDFREPFDVLLAAQIAACETVRPGVLCSAVDKAARDVIAAAGYGDYFIHRTGHGIGLEVHEDPYIVHGNDLPLEPGMAFSIEPGIYLPGRQGARIEDIVVCTETGGERLNLRPRELVVLGAGS